MAQVLESQKTFKGLNLHKYSLLKAVKHLIFFYSVLARVARLEWTYVFPHLITGLVFSALIFSFSKILESMGFTISLHEVKQLPAARQ